MNAFKNSLILLSLIGLTSSSVMAEDLKVGVVDIQKALELTKSGQKVQKEFKTEVDQEQKDIDKKKTEYEKLKDSVTKQKGSLNEKALADKEEELLGMEKELKRSFQDSQEKLRRKNAVVVGELVKQMRVIIEAMGKEKGYSVILERSGQNLLFADGSLDITEEVVKRFDSEAK
jgi:outer membrane protein